MEPVWYDIPGISGYQVTKDGQVRSHFENYGKPRVRKPSITRAGYKRVNLQLSGKTKWFLVHRLIAMAFLPQVEGKTYVNHKDGDKLNNTSENLEWCTLKENSRHAYDRGLNTGIVKAYQAHQKLTDEQVQDIRRLKGAISPKILATTYGVSIWTVYQIHANTRRGRVFTTDNIHCPKLDKPVNIS